MAQELVGITLCLSPARRVSLADLRTATSVLLGDVPFEETQTREGGKGLVLHSFHREGIWKVV